ncbi:uncharacterized protein LOC120801159 isoform X2 [Xiphias gladius]|uniref:uncharacterized protein LOC120801159 isoform X2 n=1 Tax=Xiphias gladius TaxID=8245 RepID=UPI001A9964B4|nr:uncharacterized protein LOC120801159 isoform X2 [Xiphias gladius]
MVLTACMLALIFICTGMAAKFVAPPCDLHMFDSNVDNCLLEFNNSMETSSYQDRCPWPTVKRIYNKLKFCVDDWARVSWCRGNGFLVDKVFLEVHETYFSLCGKPGLYAVYFLHRKCWIALTALCTRKRQQTKGWEAIFTDRRNLFSCHTVSLH